MPTTSIFTTIRTEGALLPADLLQRISDGSNIDGLTPESYHRSGEKLNEAINRSWNALQGAWLSFRAAQERLPSDDLGTSITRERWLLPLFRELDYGRLQTATAAEIDGRTYPISHRWEHVPLHLVSYKLDLDKRTPGATGAAIASPHSLLQVFLNRSDEHLWGFLSNGYKLRILRDNASLTRQAYVEFDLEAMMTGEVYSDFVLLWLLCHQSRVESERPSDCWLEKWMKVAEDQGTRALDQLRSGVEEAITALGLGFLEHPSNSHLRDKLQSGALGGQDYYRQLLRLVYRLLFLFVAEDRGLLLDPAADETARERYTQYYSTQRLRHMAERFKGTQHPDLYEALRLVMHLLSGESTPPSLAGEAGRGLALLPLGSFLFSDEAVPDIITCQMSNAHLLDAIRALSLTYDTRAAVYRSVDYRNLGPEELGSIYESLLELHPQIDVPARRFNLATAGGNERKTTGSYYTPTSLINALLDSALDPVIEAAIKGKSPHPSVAPSLNLSPSGGKTFRSPPPEGEGLGVGAIASRLLALKICDPACGSGHFLIAAANRIARALASVRTGEEEPPPAAIQEAKRDVIGHCIYGVDINPMAVELCKVNLWMEALEPGKPLSFLDHRIQCGNSLLGTTPALMEQGIPDDAFTPIEGDDPKFVTTMKKLNRDERKQREASVRQLELFGTAPAADYTALTRAMHELDATPDDTLAEVRRKEAQYAALAHDPEYVKARLLADAWCAAFVWQKVPATKSTRLDSWTLGEGHLGVPMPMTDLLYRALEKDPLAENLRETREYIVELTQRYQFFHWHVAFPDVFTVDTRTLLDSPPYYYGEGQGVGSDGEGGLGAATGWIGGFDCVLGNPPWERIKIQEREFFAAKDESIAVAKTASARKKLIQELKENNPYLLQEFLAEKRIAEATSSFIRQSGRFPLTAVGDVNTYPLFAELGYVLVSAYGYVGVIVPTGIATDDSTKQLFGDLIQTQSLVSLLGFTNWEFIFPTVGDRFAFCLLTISGNNIQTEMPEFIFFAHNVADLGDDWRRFTLSAQDIALINPNTHTMATFRSQHDAEITKAIYRLIPVLIQEEPLENPWQIRFTTMFHMSNDSDLFVDTPSSTRLPLYEAKMFWHFDHRYGYYTNELLDSDQGSYRSIPAPTLEQYQNPKFSPRPRHYVEVKEVFSRVGEDVKWFGAFRGITLSVNERTSIATLLPLSAVGNSAPIILTNLNAHFQACLIQNLCSWVFDFVSRQKIGGANFNFFIMHQLPVIPPHTYTQPLLDFIVPRVLELTYTAWDLQPFAQDVGYDGPPFIWDDERRFLMRCELDALYFHLYQINRADVDYIMETFPIVKRKDIAATASSGLKVPPPEGEVFREGASEGYYRTKDTILAMYDQMAALPTLHVPAPKSVPASSPSLYTERGLGGEVLPTDGLGEGITTYPVPDVSHWQTWLTPPPASPSVTHPPKATP